MRSCLFVVALAACGPKQASGPAWPAPSTTAEDGGESIAPRETKVAAAPEKIETTVDKPATTPAAAAPAGKPGEAAAPTTTPAAPPPTVEDLLISEDVIIEIED